MPFKGQRASGLGSAKPCHTNEINVCLLASLAVIYREDYFGDASPAVSPLMEFTCC